MKLRGTLRRISGLAAGCMLALAGPSAADVESLRAATVKISVEHSLGREIGSGIILCQSGGRLDVLTAKHVVTGVGLVDDFGKPLGKRFSDVRKIEVAFYRQAEPPVVVAAADVRKDEFKDLAILTVWGVDGRLSTAAVGTSTGLAAPQGVQSVGHHVGLSDGEWFWTDGKVQQSGGFIHHSSRITGGFSGGPLYDQAGRLVGINIQTVGDVARAVRIEEAVFTVQPWLDSGCLGQDIAKPPPTETPGRWKDPVLGADFVYVDRGSFWMGSPASEAGREDDERRHRVTLTRGFWMATTEVT